MAKQRRTAKMQEWVDTLPYDPGLELIDPRKLNIDPPYQRTTSSPDISSILKNFCMKAFISNPIKIGVSHNRKPKNVIDGRRRVSTAIYLKHPFIFHNPPIPCKNEMEEARIFQKINNQKSLTALQTFKVELQLRNPEAIAIDQIAMRNNFFIANASSWPHIRCIGTVRRIYKNGKLDDTLKIIWESFSWAENPCSISNAFIWGLGIFLSHYEIEPQNMIAVFSEHDPSAIVTHPDLDAVRLASGSRYKAFALLFGKMWNNYFSGSPLVLNLKRIEK